MMKKYRVTILLLCLLCSVLCSAEDYYVDDLTGSDQNTGTTAESAWKTLDKVNGITFQAGDRILLKSGGIWLGKLNPKGSGAAGNPIIIDQYGSGGMPIIDGNSTTGDGVVYLYNQEYWEINNLEITNNALEEGDRRGVMLAAGNYGLVDHIVLRNLHIHNIKGIVGQDGTAKNTGGIGIFVEADDIIDTRFDDILIEGCLIEHIDNTGIFSVSRAGGSNTPGGSNWNRRRITNLLVRNNTIHDISKNAMIIRLADGGVVEYNLCYDTAFRTGTGNTIFSRSSRGTIFQFNEGYLNKTTDYDGCLYDADLESPECVFQYSYSHDNNHGLFWMCTEPQDDNIIVRYNISQNDRGNIFCMNYAFTSAYVYNNVVYVPEHLSPKIISERRIADKTYYFYNNIIYNLSPTASYEWFNGNRTFSHNVFYGIHPATEPDDPFKMTEDPQFINPGCGGIGLDTVAGYQLLPGSPCIDSGIEVADNGGLDFWGNVVPYNGVTDRGAHEYQPAGPDTAAPTPDPAFMVAPYPVRCASAEMLAVTGSDPSGPVEYLFTETSGNPGGSSSDWQTSSRYTDTELFPGIQYAYTVTMRDALGNTSAASGPVTVTVGSSVSGTVFSDGFEDCFNNWNSDAYCSAAAYEGVKSCKLNNMDYAEAAVDTTGYSSLRISYVRKTSGLISGEYFISEWYDGDVWETIEEITNEFSDWTVVSEVELPKAAEDNPDFKIRFRVNSAAADYAYVDAVVLEGDDLCCSESADFNCNGIVDVDDLSYMVGVWLTDNSTADIALPADGRVDLSDLSVLATEWL